MDESRRSLIKQAAAAAGAVWAAPVIVSLGTPAAAGTPAPCDCEHPSTPPKNVSCTGLSGCHVFFCQAVVAPCDTVSVGCFRPPVVCDFAFIASCAQTAGNRTGGTVTSVGGLPPPFSCEAFGITVGGQVEFEYSLSPP